jgi:Secretion system C-terminal sorting domain
VSSPNYSGGYSGDGGPATAAELYQPASVVTDTSGRVYISDAVNNCIRRVALGIYEPPSPSPKVYNSISIFPTPTFGAFTITGVTAGQVIKMYNYLGQELSKTLVDNTVMQFDISTKANGAYFIRILNSNGSIETTKKIVKTD